MPIDYIFSAASGAVRRCDTRDPFRIAEESGVKVYFRDDFTRLKGMYAVVKRRRCIFINRNLPEHKMRIVCAHELGHDALHRELAKNAALQEFMLYDMTLRPEYETNVYAAHLLLNEDEILQLAQSCRSLNAGQREWFANRKPLFRDDRYTPNHIIHIAKLSVLDTPV